MKERQSLRVSRFDAVTSALMTVMIFAASVTGVLLLLWLVSGFEPDDRIRPVPPIGRTTSHSKTIDDSIIPFEQPGDPEFQDLIQPTFADTVEAVTAAASSVSGSYANRVTDSNATSFGSTGGPSRPPGPDNIIGDDTDLVPRSERWQLNFTARNQADYIKQLEFFQIELGAVGGEIVGLDIVNNLASSPKSRRLEDATTEKRLYFVFKRPSPLMVYERAIHAQAGVDLQDRNMLKLISPQLENMLAKIELDYAISKGHPSITEVAKTVFESKLGRSGFEFQVVTQRYRNKR